MEGMADSIDVVPIGAYYGKAGNRKLCFRLEWFHVGLDFNVIFAFWYSLIELELTSTPQSNKWQNLAN